MKELLSLFQPPLKDDPLFSIKKEAWDELQNSVITEDFQYVPVRSLFAEGLNSFQAAEEKIDLTPYILPGCENSYVVFYNGSFSKELSNVKGLDILPLPKAMSSYGVFLQNRLQREIKKEKDPFSLLNLAVHSQGAFIYVRQVVETPIQIIQIVSGNQSIASPRLQIVVNKGGKVNFLHTIHGNISGLCNLAVDIVIEEKGELSWQDSSFLSENSWYFSSMRATIKKEAHLNCFSFTNGSKSARSRFAITLAESEATCTLKGLSLLDKEREGHVHVLMEHASPNCYSRQHFKSVLKDQSKSSFEGKIHVHPKAIKTEAYQLTNHLLLSDKAAAYAKPNLQIYADDVKASHGATIAKIDEEEIFYLRSRGLSQKDSMKLLALGFSEQHIKDVFLPIKEQIQKILRGLT